MSPVIRGTLYDIRMMFKEIALFFSVNASKRMATLQNKL